MDRNGTDTPRVASAIGGGEHRRLHALHRLGPVESPGEADYDDIVRHAARMLDTPMAAIVLVDEHDLWFKAHIGLGVRSARRDDTFCDHVVTHDGPLVVTDTHVDPRFDAHPFVVGPQQVRFAAGVPVHAFGEAVGALCVYDARTRLLDPSQLDTLRFLARQVEHLIALDARRAIDAPPSVHTVEQFAARITAGEPFETVASAIDRPSFVCDLATLEILAVNDRAVEHYGFSRNAFLDGTILDLRPPSERPALLSAIANGNIDRNSGARLWRHCRADGSTFDAHVTITPTTFHGRDVRLAVVTDMTSRLAITDALEHASLVDSLTGLANRSRFIRALGERLDAGEPPVGVFFVDLDRFKVLNDTMGHDLGDALLAAAAVRIHECVPADGLVARLGGDEFGVIRSVRDLAGAARFAEVLRAALERPFVIDDGDQYLSASIGVVVSDHAATAQSLLAEADAAMYAAKDAGRNSVAVADHALRRRMAEWSDIQRDLHRAIDDGELELDLQPIVDLRTGDLAYEALARWNHPTRGRLAPAAFITVAEESGLIRRLGAHLLALGASHAAELDACVSVNVSPLQFNRMLVHQVATLIGQYQLRPGQLIIEVTESAVVDSDRAQVVLAGLRGAGADIWIDDFGTGYSSLARLGSMQFDGLKLAREFVNDLDSAHGWGIATAIVGIARALCIDVIAEGVETERQLDQLHLLDCDAAQGFLLGRPRPFEQVRGRARAATLVAHATHAR